MSTELVKVEEYAIAVKGDTIQELLEANLGGGKLNAWDMETVKFPSGKATTWSVDDITEESGAREVKELTGIIIHYADARRFWKEKFGESEASAPDCISRDLDFGEGTPGGECETCEFNEWVDKHPPACKIARDMMILLPDAMLPINISIGPGSYTNIKKYFTKLVSAGAPYWKVVTSLTLATAQSTGKKRIDYPKASARMVQLIEDPAIIGAVDTYRALINKTVTQD